MPMSCIFLQSGSMLQQQIRGDVWKVQHRLDSCHCLMSDAFCFTTAQPGSMLKQQTEAVSTESGTAGI